VNIPSAVGGGNTRIDRIVLRASWASFVVRIVRIAGTDAASPTAPAITQTSGTTYDVMLYQALVNTSGTVTLTDEQVWALVATDDNTLEHSAGTLRIKDNGVITAKILDANVTAAKLASNAVTTAKILDANVTAAKLGADSVDDTKAGNRIIQMANRQGGSSTGWASNGTNNYVPTAVRMQVGAGRSVGSTITVTFPVAFSNTPVVLVAITNGPARNAQVVTVSATQFDVEVYDYTGTPATGNFTWLAIGPE
jgi:hypothetical protein